MYKLNWIQSPLSNEIELFSSQASIEKLDAPLLFIGGIHGDEPEGVYLAESLKEWIKTVSNKPLNDYLLIPCINIDGYNANTRVNSRGVDLNRNFPTRNWSQKASADRYFPGEKPASETEVQAVVDLINKAKPRMIFHFHSWKPCIVVTGPTDSAEVSYLASASGYEVQQDIGYPTPGSLGEYGWSELNIPVICTEDSEHRTKSLPWQHFGEGLQKILLK